jgi:hypothetical protein
MEDSMVLDRYLKEVVINSSKCTHCVLNHDGICFFAYRCIMTDFYYYMEE